MSRYVLDTSAYAHFQRGASEMVELLDAAEWIGVPAVVLGEIWIGFLLGTRVQENERGLREFLANAVVEQIVVDAAVARIYAQMIVSLRAAGNPLPVNDVWVAASAAAAGAPVVTYDSHFRQIASVGAIVLR